MHTPFTTDQFFDTLAAFNRAVWPLVVLLWLASVFAVIVLIRNLRSGGRFITAVLAAQWASAAFYHVAFFSTINPVARIFGGIFLVESALLMWYGVVRGQLRWSRGRSSRHLLSWIVIAYGLLYPLIVLAEGHTYPRMPAFGVPCPTTILTAGFLLAADPPMPLLAVLIPIAWSALGGLAPFQFGVRADLGLLAAGIILAAYVLASLRPKVALRA